MAQKFKEVAHLRTDLDKYGDNYDRIFGGKETPKEDEFSHEEIRKIKELARKCFQEIPYGQDTEGFPESTSFIFGFLEGYKKGREK